MSTNDLELVRTFVRDGSQDAFTALVRRHLDLVYCAALRQVRSPEMAEEVAQSVFADLARNAAHLRDDTILPAWLYEITRRTAIDAVRSEVRRQAREHVAMELNVMNAPSSDPTRRNAADADWEQIEPLLDEAMQALDPGDRNAVLLRYFENKSLREVGEVLGASEEAARKRVSRAVDRLRDTFAKRGVGVGASALVAFISARAVQAAPAGLLTTVALAGAAATGTAVFTSTLMTMKLIKAKTVGIFLVALAIGTGAYWVGRRSAPSASLPPRPEAAATQETDELLYREMLAAYPVASEVMAGHPTRVLWEERKQALLQAGYIEARAIPLPSVLPANGGARAFFDRFQSRFFGVEMGLRGLNGEPPPQVTVTARRTDFGPAGEIERFIRTYDPKK